jgi:hypothetical protein
MAVMGKQVFVQQTFSNAVFTTYPALAGLHDKRFVTNRLSRGTTVIA